MLLLINRLFLPASIHSPSGLSGLARCCCRALFLCLVVAWQFVGIPNVSAQALTQGTVAGWGYNGSGQITPPADLSGVTAIAAGASHSLALKSDGSVIGWGANFHGQTTPPAGLSGVTTITAGASHSLALKSDGSVIGWGDNGCMQTTPPAGLSGLTTITAGLYFSLALKSDGSVIGWGDNGNGQATPPAGLSGVTAITAGDYYSLAVNTPSVDTTTPTVTLVAPTQNARYSIKQSVPASYSCTDPSTVILCSGSLPVGALIDTARKGAFTFIVTATDGQGNTGSTLVNYTVEAGPGAPPVKPDKPVKGK